MSEVIEPVILTADNLPPDEEPRTLLKMVPVVDASFLDEHIVNDCIAAAGYGSDEMYVEWNTGWDFSLAAKVLSQHLCQRGIPKGLNVLIKKSY